MRAAIYARVSTERQEQQQTIGSQVATLRDWAAARDHVLAEAHVFRDEGYSGSRLDRPALDALRDAVRDAAVDVVAVFSPDRLARKYAYQVLLMEEFRRAGCEVAFLHRPISDDPNDQLLLQIQGAVAEYERAVLAERFRRGKLQRARDGGIVGAKAPYGYRYEGRRGAVLARLVVDEAEAAMVRDLYAWVVEDGLTVRQCTKRLDAGPWVTRSGRAQWSSSVVHHILTDPVYIGVTYANRFAYVAPRQRRGHSRRGTERTCRRPRPPEQWIAIPVPPLVDQRTWDGARRARAQCRAGVPPQQEARLHAALPAEVRPVRPRDPRLLLGPARRPARQVLLSLRRGGPAHDGPRDEVPAGADPSGELGAGRLGARGGPARGSRAAGGAV
jgi:site-specific DNA recombinase